MRLPGVWERAPDDRAAEEVLREAVRLGVDFIDTAEAYGPHTSERLIPAALRPYPENLVIATKGGLGHDGRPEGRPERLREGCVGSLRRLGLETIDLWQPHRIDPTVPLEEQFGAIRELQDEGKIRLVGVSEVVDTGQRDVTVPADLADALATEDAARRFFESLAYTHRKEWVRWIEEAKKGRNPKHPHQQGSRVAS